MPSLHKQGVFFYNKEEYDKAFRYFLSSSQLNTTDPEEKKVSLWYLATLYRYGSGTSKDINKCIELFEESGNMGYGYSWFSLGWLYEKGKVVDLNLEKALECYTKGALLGNINCQINLGVMYDEGKGTLKDKSEAFKWFKAASDQGDIDATYNLGLMYQYGEGVPPNVVKAQKLFCEAGEYSFGLNGNVPFDSVQVLRNTSTKIDGCGYRKPSSAPQSYDYATFALNIISELRG